MLCVLYDSDVLSREVVDRVAGLLGTNATTRLVGVGLSDLRDRYPRVGMGGHPGATLTPLAKSHYQQLAYAYAYRVHTHTHTHTANPRPETFQTRADARDDARSRGGGSLVLKCFFLLKIQIIHAF